MKWQYLYLKLSSRSIGVAYLEIKKDAACMHTELSAVLNSCFVNWYHYWVSRHMFRFFPWNSKSLIVSIPISCNRGYPLWENSIDLSWPITSVQNAYLKNIFFFLHYLWLLQLWYHYFRLKFLQISWYPLDYSL